MIKKSGFTLIEIVIVLAIIAILIALAVPSYEYFIRKTRRADAQVDLIQFASDAERVFTQFNSYATVILPANTDFYTYSFPVAVTASTYTIRATPKTDQSADRCGTMNLTQTGQRTKTGAEANCW